MLDSPHVRFVLTLMVALAVAGPITAVLTPPDPFTQLLVAGALLIAALPIAYYLSYRGGYESILRSSKR